MHKQTKFELFVVLVHMGWTVTEKENLHCKYIYKEDDGDISSREFLIGKALHREYLMSLILAESLLQEGLERIYHEQSKAYYSCVQSAKTLAAKGLLRKLQPGKDAGFYKELLRMANSKPKAGEIPGAAKARATAVDLTDEQSLFDREPQNVPAQPQSTRRRHVPDATQRKEKMPTGAEASADDADVNIISASDSESKPREDEEQAGSNLDILSAPVVRRSRKRQLPSASKSSGSTLLEAVASVSQERMVKDTAAKMTKGNEEKHQLDVGKRQKHRHVLHELPQMQDDQDDVGFIQPKVESEAFTGSVSADVPGPVIVLPDSDDETNIGIGMQGSAAESGSGPSSANIAMEESASALLAPSAPASGSGPSSANIAMDASALLAPSAAGSGSGPSSANTAMEESASALLAPSAAAMGSGPSSATGEPPEASSASKPSKPPKSDSKPKDHIPERSSMFNDSTVWLDDVPVVKRTDKKGSVSCPD